MFDQSSVIKSCDVELYSAWLEEVKRQEDHIELIASENYTSPAVMALQGSELTNKYAEGYPRKRYYGGCEHVDRCEELAIDRLKEIYGASYANVQPHSGSQANAAVYQALLKPNDTVVAMDLAAGGHLTHGCPVNFSGKLYDFHLYGVNHETGLIDYDQVEALAVEVKPKLIIAGMSAYSRTVDWKRFRDIADRVGALYMVDMAHVSGLVAAGIYDSPVPYADVVTSTTHKTLRGPRGGFILAKNDPALHKALNSSVFPGMQGGPLMHVIAAKAVAFKEAMNSSFKDYCQQVVRNAQVMAETMQSQGYRIVSGGTDCHMFLVDLTDKGITGKDAEAFLAEAHLTTNKNTVPGETRSPFVTSGLRIGTAAMTTRGFKEKESAQVASMMCELLDNFDSDSVQEKVRNQAIKLCRSFPVYTSNRDMSLVEG